MRRAPVLVVAVVLATLLASAGIAFAHDAGGPVMTAAPVAPLDDDDDNGLVGDLLNLGELLELGDEEALEEVLEPLGETLEEVNDFLATLFTLIANLIAFLPP